MKYTIEDLQLVDFGQSVVRNQKLYFGSNGATPQAIAGGISDGALALGCTDSHVVRLNDWWLVYSSNDWLEMPNKLAINASNAFSQLNAFPEMGDNQFRYECMAWLFSSALATAHANEHELIKGGASDLADFLALAATLKDAARIVGFKFCGQPYQ